MDEACFSTASSGLSALTGFLLARTSSASGLIADMKGFLSEKSSKRSRFGCIARIASAIGSRDGGPNKGLGERAIEAEIDLGQPRDCRKALLVLGAVDAEGADVVERSRLEPEEILAVDKVAVRRVLADVGDDGLIEAGRRRLDHLHAGDELAVLLGRDLARDEDAEVPDDGCSE